MNLNIQSKVRILSINSTSRELSPPTWRGNEPANDVTRSSTAGVDVICGLSLLLVLSLAPRGFCPGIPVSPSPQRARSKINFSEFQFDQEW